jgi:hypothetical protein
MRYDGQIERGYIASCSANSGPVSAILKRPAGCFPLTGMG